MTPTKPMDRPTYLEWCKTLPEGCTLCNWQETQLVLKEYPLWVWVYSVAPYKKWNTMIVPKRHLDYFHDLTIYEVDELKAIMKEAYDVYHHINEVSEYMWMWRTRDPDFGKIPGQKLGKRLDHLHVHFIPEVTRWLDPILEPDASNEEIFNKMREAVTTYAS